MSSLNPIAGIISTANQNATYLPLESLVARVYIADISARVLLNQLYFNPAPDPLVEAYYVFPVPARGAVCSFEMRTDDGRCLKGFVREVSQAKAEYEDAVRQGKLAGLLQQVTQDVFVVCLGAIPPRTAVTIILSYVTDLSEDDQHDTIRFQLPFYVGARYGETPTSILHGGTVHKARLSITAEVEMASSIIDVRSPTHPQIKRSQDYLSESVPNDHYACVRLDSMTTFLKTEFLLVVQASGLDVPRCLAETLSLSQLLPSMHNGRDTTALALTIVPRFKLPTLPEQEYIFIIDRSFSMAFYQRIETAKESLGYLLRRLPGTSATKFNIVSFGHNCSPLWPQSQPYNDDTLYDATFHAQAMEADMGPGTDLFSALEVVFASRTSSIPTSVFVLTDGKVIDTQGTIDYVRKEVSSSLASAPLRLFTLGVGHGASTRLCEGIAKAGKGFCSMALEVEDLMMKSVRLVDAMRVSTVTDLTVDWEVPDQALQFPDPIPTISPGVRSVVTAILPHTPTHVTLKGCLSDGNILEYRVPVRTLSTRYSSFRFDDSESVLQLPPLIHTLAANRYIQGLDGGGLKPSHFRALSPGTRHELMKDLIVELGVQYQLTSRYTAFVAVDVPPPPRPPPPPGPATPPPPSAPPATPPSTPPPSSTPPGIHLPPMPHPASTPPAASAPLPPTPRPPTPRPPTPPPPRASSPSPPSTPPAPLSSSPQHPSVPPPTTPPLPPSSSPPPPCMSPPLPGAATSPRSMSSNLPPCTSPASPPPTQSPPPSSHPSQRDSARAGNKSASQGNRPGGSTHGAHTPRTAPDGDGGSVINQSPHFQESSHKSSPGSKSPAAASKQLSPAAPTKYSTASTRSAVSAKSTAASRKSTTTPRKSTAASKKSAHALRKSTTTLRNSAVASRKSFATSDRLSSTPPPAQRGGDSSPEVGQQPEFFAYDTPIDTAADEVVVLSDPLGGDHPIICTAPPLPQTSIYSRFPGRAFLALIFHPLETTRRLISYGASTMQAVRQTVWSDVADVATRKELLKFSLQQAAGGSFALSHEFSSVLGVPQESVRAAMPSALALNDDGEQIWATAVAVAFLRLKHARERELWEILQSKACEFGAASLAGGSDEFEGMVREALKLFP